MAMQTATLQSSGPAHTLCNAISVLLLACLLPACGSSSGGSEDGGLLPEGNLDAGPVDAAADVTRVPPVCTSGTSLTCACEGGTGQRACVEGQLSPTCDDCQPSNVPEGANLCEAGRYEGSFDVPEYLPTAAGCRGLGTLFGGPGTGMLGFTLAKGSGGDVYQVVETESCFEMQLTTEGDGGADTQQTQPASFELAGSVDCFDGVFQGEIRGAYRAPQSLCDPAAGEIWYSVKGVIRAVFDAASKTFIDGTLELYEPKQLGDEVGLTPRAGGGGTWQATLDTEAERPEPVDDCLAGGEFTDFEI